MGENMQIAEFHIPKEKTALENIIKQDTTVRFEKIIPIKDGYLPYIKIKNNIENIEQKLKNKTNIEKYRVLHKTKNSVLMFIDWEDTPCKLIDILFSLNIIIKELRADKNGWRLQILFPEKQTISEFYKTTKKENINITLQKINNQYLTNGRRKADLTPKQKEVLELALKNGYFDIPRKITTKELSDMVDISDTAISQRLRRAMKKLTKHQLEIN